MPIESIFSGPRILLREITGRMPRALLGTYTDEVYVHNPSVLAVLPKANALDPKFILGILNSRLVSAAFTQLGPKASKGLFPKVIITDARRLPFPRVDISTPSGRMLHDSLVDLVNQLLSVMFKIDQASVASDAAILERHVAVLDGRIDQVVYELYGLTDDEIALVESGFEKGRASMPLNLSRDAIEDDWCSPTQGRRHDSDGMRSQPSGEESLGVERKGLWARE